MGDSSVSCLGLSLLKTYILSYGICHGMIKHCDLWLSTLEKKIGKISQSILTPEYTISSSTRRFWYDLSSVSLVVHLPDLVCQRTLCAVCMSLFSLNYESIVSELLFRNGTRYQELDVSVPHLSECHGSSHWQVKI